VSPTALPYQRLQTVEILQLPVFRSSCHSRPCRARLNCQPSTDSSAGLGFSLYSLGADPTENTASNSPSIVVMGSRVAIARISFPLELVYGAVAQSRPFVYLSIAWQRLYSLFASRSLPSNGSILHSTVKSLSTLFGSVCNAGAKWGAFP
jgi:hypothetical protein